MTTDNWQLLAEWNGGDGDEWEVLFGAWESVGAGIRISSATKLLLFFGDHPAAGLRLAMDEVTGEAPVYFELDEYAFDIGGSAAPVSKIYQSWGPTAVLGATGQCRRTATGAHQLICERDNGRVCVKVDGVDGVSAEDPAPGRGLVSLTVGLAAGTIVKGLRIERRGAGVAAAVPIRGAPACAVDVCIDFLDDLQTSAWSEQTFDAVMAYHKANGVRRIHFIYTCGAKGGWWDQLRRMRPDCAVQQNVDKTYDAVGDFLPATVKAAHAHGLEVIAVYKPYETAMGYTVPHGSEDARTIGKIPALGGMIWRSIDFTARNPHLRMERLMDDVPADLAERRVGRIVFTAEAGLDTRLDPDCLRLWVSHDNGCYRKLESGYSIELDKTGWSHQLRIEGLSLTERFIAFEYKHGGRPPTFGNTVASVAQVFDTEGRLLPMTFSRAVNPPRDGKRNFAVDGFAMDAPGTCMEDYFWVDSGLWALGIGRERYISGALCPSYPEVQDFWMQQVENCIAAGADGVDLRLHHHNRTFDWSAYGFGERVIADFKQLHGVDIRHEPFDREALRQLRAGYHTAFIRRASTRLRQAGRMVHAHVEMRQFPKQWPTYMEIRFEWEKWLADGLLDEVTIKSFRTVRSHFPLEVIQRARAADVKVNICPYINDLVRHAEGPRQYAFLRRDAQSVHPDGFTIYENAAALKANFDGTLSVIHPWIFEPGH